MDQEALKEKWDDLSLIEEGVVPLTTDNGEDGRIDNVWADYLELKTSFGLTRFPVLRQVMPNLLCLPHSNADSERAFSMVRKIHTENRTRLAPDTLAAFLQIKLNSDGCCHDLKVTSSMLNNELQQGTCINPTFSSSTYCALNLLNRSEN